MAGPPTSRRGALHRDDVVAAAVALADDGGLGAVSMRSVAGRLGVEAMSLYHHVANKSDILDGMIDMVFAEIELPDDDAEWTTAMADRARSVRAALTRHRWAIGLMESRVAPGPATLRHHDAVIGCCRRAGFTVEMTAHAFSLIDSYIYGFILQEINLPFDDGDDLGALVDTIMPPEMAEAYPHLTELTTEVVLQPGYSYGDEFDFGLDLVLAAIVSRRRPSTGRGATAS